MCEHVGFYDRITKKLPTGIFFDRHTWTVQGDIDRRQGAAFLSRMEGSASNMTRLVERDDKWQDLSVI